MEQLLKLDDFIDHEESRDALRELFPNGFHNFSLDGIKLSSNTDAEISVLVLDKPAIAYDKWGTWGEDYNALILRFGCFLNKKILVQDWQNNLTDDIEYRCNAEISTCAANDYGIKYEKDITLRFWDDNWTVEIVTKALIFQKGHITAFYPTDDPEYL